MQPQNDSTRGRLFGLDALRAAAVLLVLISHSWPVSAGQETADAAGIIGVELFFVLSGFLIGGILLRSLAAGRFGTGRELVAFWQRRWFRTLPNYYLFLGLWLLWFAWKYQNDGGQVWGLLWRYCFFLQNLFSQPPFVFGESWSLAVEEWFYLLFAVLLWAGVRLTRAPWKTCLAVIVVFLVLPALYKLMMLTLPQRPGFIWTEAEARRVWQAAFQKPVIARLDVPMYGVAAAYLSLRHPAAWKKLSGCWGYGLALLGLAATSLAVDWPLSRGSLFEGQCLFPCIDLAAVLLLCRLSFITDQAGRGPDLLRFFAAISYSLYLTQLPVVMLLELPRPGSDLPLLSKYTWPWALAIWVLAIGSAWVVHRWFERPMMNLRDRRGKKGVRHE